MAQLEHSINFDKKFSHKNGKHKLTRRLEKRQGRTCQICGTTKDITIDHKIPRWYLKQIGLHPRNKTEEYEDIRNTWFLCISCHKWKNKTMGDLKYNQPERPLTIKDVIGDKIVFS